MINNQEEKIIDECQKGNLQKFDYLYELYVKKIYDFTFYKTFDKELAQDITSQTFLNALEKIDSFNPKKGNFVAWIFQIAKNLIIDYFKSKKPDMSIDDIWDLPSKNDVVKEADLKIRFEKAKKILNKLDANQRNIIILRLWHDLSYNEISQITKKSEAACKMIFKRTIKKLQNEDILKILIIIFLIR